MAKSTLDLTKSDNLNASTEVKAPVNDVKLTADVSNESETVQEEPKAQTAQKTKQSRVHVLYIGNGIWQDEKGEKWSKNSVQGTNIKSERAYEHDEYEKRNDIHFMVEYGAMKAINA